MATERLTACANNRVLQINLGAPPEMRAWTAACPVNALGRHALGRARATLAWVVNYIDDWADSGADEAYATPTADRPHLTVIIDEVADVAADDVCKRFLRSIVQKGRKAGVTLIIAGQRGTATWIGGADVRALIDYVVVGRFTQPGEANKVIGVHLDLPDFAGYGGGAHGVFMIVNRGSGAYDRGRVVKLKEPRDMRRIARQRTWLADWVPAGMDEEQARLWALITGDEEPGPDDWELPVAGADDEDQAAAHADDAETARWVERHKPGGTWDHDREALPGLEGSGIPEAVVVNEILPLSARPEGVSAGQLAHRIGKSRETARKYLKIMVAAGYLRAEGEGISRRYYEADRPALTVIDGGHEGGDATRD